MKKYPALILSAFAALALGGCATTSGLVASTEDDGVYYSSRDKTELTPEARQALEARYSQQQNNGGYAVSRDVATGDDNPEYYDDGTTQAAGDAEYYDDDYGYSARLRRFNQSTYSGLGYSSLAYTDPFWNGGMMSPYGYGSSFYDPFYGPGFGFGPRLGFGLSMGYGGFYRPYGLGLGYGGGFYDPFYGPYGGLGYGGLGYGLGYGGLGYGLGYGGYPIYGGGFGVGGERYGSNANYQPRRDRSTEALSSRPNYGSTRGGQAVAPNTGSGNSVIGGNYGNGVGRGRSRILGNGMVGSAQQNANLGIPADQPQTGDRAGRRGRTADGGGQVGTAQPQRNRVYNNSGQNNQSSRSFEQSNRSTYSQPSRSSSFGGSGGGGSFGGGSSGGGRGRVR